MIPVKLVAATAVAIAVFIVPLHVTDAQSASTGDPWVVIEEPTFDAWYEESQQRPEKCESSGHWVHVALKYNKYSKFHGNRSPVCVGLIGTTGSARAKSIATQTFTSGYGLAADAVSFCDVTAISQKHHLFKETWRYIDPVGIVNAEHSLSVYSVVQLKNPDCAGTALSSVSVELYVDNNLAASGEAKTEKSAGETVPNTIATISLGASAGGASASVGLAPITVGTGAGQYPDTKEDDCGLIDAKARTFARVMQTQSYVIAWADGGWGGLDNAAMECFTLGRIETDHCDLTDGPLPGSDE